MPVNREWLLEIDEYRYQDPKEALRKLRAVAEDVPRELLPLYLGVCASSIRSAAGRGKDLEKELKKAERNIRLGLAAARKNDDELSIGDLLQRLAHVVARKGEIDRALSLANEAGGIYDRRRFKSGRGKALTDQGEWLFLMGNYNESIIAFRRALATLPECERRHRLAAYNGLGSSLLETKRIDLAIEYFSKAKQLAQSMGRFFSAKIIWAQARVYMNLNRLAEAETMYRQAIDQLPDLTDTAIATIDLVECQLLQNLNRKAYKTALTMRAFLHPLRKNKVVSSMIIDLIRNEQKLTIGFVRMLQKRLNGSQREPRADKNKASH